jgi:uncharacterized protein YggE
MRTTKTRATRWAKSGPSPFDPTLLGLIGLILIYATWASPGARAATPLTPNARLELTVAMTIDTAPDTASVHFQAFADAQTSEEARALATARLKSLLTRLAAAGIAQSSLVFAPSTTMESITAEWIENEELVYGEVIATRATRRAWLDTSDLALAARFIDALARDGEGVTFQASYSLSPPALDKVEQEARRLAIVEATTTARAVARANGWRIAEMLPTRRQPSGGSAADLGGAFEDREWGQVTVLEPSVVTTHYDLTVTFRLVR